MVANEPIPLLPSNPEALDGAERSELVGYYEHCASMESEWLYRQIVDNNRIDILAIAVLGYQVQPFHLAMMRFQFSHPDNLQLAFRGAGKTTVCTVTKVIHLLCKNRNLRILLASKTTSNAESFLKEIKAHLEGNQKLIDIFGAFYDPQKVAKWDNKEIEVVGRTIKAKESTVTCVGVEGTIVSKHVDVVISDDLIDEDNARTPYMRERTKKWYYQTLGPILEPPDSMVPHRGEHHRLGTRYHFADLWGHLIENELAEHHQVIKALNDDEESPWPEKYTTSWFKEKKRISGLIIFNAQYQNDTEAMKGEIFQYDHCQQVNEDQIPADLQIFMGVDLAISEKDKADLFSIVVGGFDKLDNCYILDYFEGHLRFNAQTKAIKKYYRKHDPIRAGIEINAYQEAQYQNLKDDDRDIRLTPITTSKDKITRAWKLSPRFEDLRMFFRKAANLGRLLDALVLFPNFRYKDGFDALDMMIQAKLKKKRRRRPRKEPGVI